MTAIHSASAPLALRPAASPGDDMAALVGLGGGGVAEVPVAVFLRTSTRDLQDPTLSLPRQLDNCRKVLPPGFTIEAIFYDVESSRKDLDQRGLGSAHEAFNIPIPRDGGLADLLTEAQHPGRRFEAVVVEEIERAARWTHQSTQLEHTLEKVGVPLFAADEGPISITEKRATQILVRRMKQGVGEWFLRHTLEQSWEGFREHTKQGWNIGKACYGYISERLPHPVAAKAEDGKTKSRLLVDPDRGPTVTQIYLWRHDERLAYKVIAERLNLDLDLYPPPQPNRRERARNCWTVSTVREILCNPKYTGYMIWNRRASKKGGKVNPPDKWIWSPKPTHEPLVTLELWNAVQEIAKARQGSRMTGSNTHPATRRTYVLRHHTHCTLCNKRMFGKTRKQHAYYSCQPQLDRVGNPQDYADHPRSIYVREDRLLDCVQTFFTQRILGQDRAVLLRRQIAKQGTRQRHDHHRRIEAMEKSIADLARRQDNLMDEREAKNIDDGDEIGRAWAERLRARFADLENQRRTKQAELDKLRIIAEREQPQQPELLDLLPQLALILTDAPDPLQRDLYQACRLKIYYDHNTRHVTIHATLRADTLHTIALATAAIAPTSTNTETRNVSHPAPMNRNDVAHVLRVLPGAPVVTRPNGLCQRSWKGSRGMLRGINGRKTYSGRMGEQGGGSRGRTRPKGSIEELKSASLRVRVYAGIDALSGRKLYLKEVIPAGPDAWERAEEVRDRFVRQVAEGRQPKTNATIAQMLERYLAEWEGSDSYRKGLCGYVRNHVNPFLGTKQAEGLELDVLDSFYRELKRCRHHCDGRPHIQHRTGRGGGGVLHRVLPGAATGGSMLWSRRSSSPPSSPAKFRQSDRNCLLGLWKHRPRCHTAESEPPMSEPPEETETGKVISIFGIDDDEMDTGRVDRSRRRGGDEVRYGRSEIPTEVFRRRVENFVTAMRDVIGGIAATAGSYQLDQVQVSVEVSAKGHVSLLGTGGELAGKGGLTFTFKKPPNEHVTP